MPKKNLEKMVFFDGDGVAWNFDTDFGSSWIIVRSLLNGKEKKMWDYEREIFHQDFKSKTHKEYSKYIEIQFELIKGKEIKDTFKIPYTFGFQKFSGYLKNKNYYRILLSGGFWPVLVKAKHHFDEIIGNYISIEKNKLKDIKVLVTPFNKQKIIKEYSSKAQEVMIFVDPHEYGIFKDEEIIRNKKYKIYLINPENKNHNLNFINKEFENFKQAINYFKNEVKF